MTFKLLKETVRMIGDAGGTQIDIRQGGNHLFVEFLNPEGEPHRVPLHRGKTPKDYTVHALRSRLRKAGLAL